MTALLEQQQVFSHKHRVAKGIDSKRVPQNAQFHKNFRLSNILVEQKVQSHEPVATQAGIAFSRSDLIFVMSIAICLLVFYAQLHFLPVLSQVFVDVHTARPSTGLQSEFSYAIQDYPAELAEEPPAQIDSSQFEGLALDSYTIEAGDTLSGISEEFNVTLDTIISFNRVESARRLQIGQVLQIPNRDGLLHTVEAGESLNSIANEYNASFNAILDVNSLFSEEIFEGQVIFIPNVRLDRTTLGLVLGELFIYPTRGTFTSAFGYRNDPFTGERRFHYGIDIANSRGTRIQAAMDGRVVYVDSLGSGNYGKYVIMQHAGGFQSLYAHFDEIGVQRGNYVYQGTAIGTMGNTGRSTGDHLHFSIIRNGSFVDPLAYLH